MTRVTRSVVRVRRLTLIPFLTALAVAAAAGVLNPRGWTNVFTAAIPAAAASLGLTQLDHFVPGSDARDLSTQVIGESWRWIIAGAVVALLFIGVLGPGVRW
jgi:hypothetical protein